MRKPTALLYQSLLLLLYSVEIWGAENPFSRGVNLTKWLQAPSARQVQFSKFGRQDLLQIRSLGADVVRLPINLHAMTSGPPAYEVDPLLYVFLDQIVGWAHELGLHLILDNHTFDPAERTSPQIGEILIPVWTQLAAHFAANPAELYYEVLNEPHGIADPTWNEIQAQVIEAIRAVDQRHTIIIGPANWNSYRNLAQMPVYDDPNLIYTFHFYDPFLFTHQGASWTDPSMGPLAGVPFPYDPARMPALPAVLRGSWVGNAMGTYDQEGTIARVQESIDMAARFRDERGVLLFCGEFGTHMPNSDASDRVLWYEVVRRHLEARGIAWTIWDYQGGFGLFERGSSERFDFDLNLPLLRALGLNVPEQLDFELEPTMEGFELYGDANGSGIAEASYIVSGLIDFYSEQDPAFGRYCIDWTGVGQYQSIGFDFRPIKDLSILVAAGYVLEFWVRGSTPGTSFDVRLVDTDTDDPDDHPWRVRVTVDEERVSWDGEWHHVQLALSDFVEHGAWEDEWFEPRGVFDWQAIDRFEIVAEHHDLKDIHFGFDQLQIAAPSPSVVAVGDQVLPQALSLEPNYPNPFNAATTIRYELAVATLVQIAVYDMAGQQVRVLVDEWRAAGRHAVGWNGVDSEGRASASGIYVYEMTAAGRRAMGKMVLVR